MIMHLNRDLNLQSLHQKFLQKYMNHMVQFINLVYPTILYLWLSVHIRTLNQTRMQYLLRFQLQCCLQLCLKLRPPHCVVPIDYERLLNTLTTMFNSSILLYFEPILILTVLLSYYAYIVWIYKKPCCPCFKYNEVLFYAAY